MAARVVDAAFAVVYLRLLGRPEVGDYTFLVVFTTYLDTLIDFGLNALVARDVSRGLVAARTAFRSVSVLRLGLWLIGLLIAATMYGPLREVANLSDEAALAGAVFYVALLPTVIAKTATGVLWSAERLELTAMVSVVATILRTVIGTAALFAGYGLIGLAATSLLINVVTAGLLAVLSRPWLGARRAEDVAHTATAAPSTSPGTPTPTVAPTPSTATGMTSPGQPTYRQWVQQSWPLFLNQLLQGLFFKIDALLLLPLGGALAAGAYAAAYKVSEGAGIVSSSFTLALFPRLSRGADNLSGAYRLALRTLLQVAFPLAVGIALLSEPIVAVVGGRDYLPDSAIALSILIAYLPLSYANGLTQYVLIAARRQRLLTAAFVAALIFNVVANLALIPRFTYIGAACVTVLSELVLLVPFQLAAARVAPNVSLFEEARTPILATLLMAPVVWWVRDAMHPVAAIAAGAIVYPLALWALGGISREQIGLALQIAGRTQRSSAAAPRQ